MADEIDTQLAKLEEAAPLTPEVGDDDFQQQQRAPVKTEEQPNQPAKTEEEKAAAAAAAKVAQTPDELATELETIRKKYADKEGLAASERAKRRAAEATAAAAQQELARINAYIQQQRQRQQLGKIPDPEENVIDALKYERNLRIQRERADAQQRQQQEEMNRQLGFVNQLKTTVEDFEQEFREQNPDYDEAADWLVDMEQRRLEMAGIPKQQAEQGAVNWAINMANIMVSQGKNPAQVAYEAAKMMNWQPKAGAAGAATQAMQQAAAQQAANEQKMAAQKAGQAAAKTISGGGAQASGDTSLAAIGELHGAAFDSALEKFFRNNR